ncbi:MAG TPA: hypothetical protein VM051_13510 [Usitatibacter sp.]|nr:hypothetical protein [Usitatibacter sp.]
MMPRKCLAALLAAALPAVAEENPAARKTAADLVSLRGYWNGANLENRSNCATAGVNGIHGTYAQYFFSVNPPGSMQIHEDTVSGLSCDYIGTYADERFQPSWNGTFSCSDGKRGTFESRSFLITPTEMQARLRIKLQNAEGCDVDSILGGSRFF